MLIRFFLIMTLPLVLAACTDAEDASSAGEVVARDGASIYRQYCVVCHSSGAGGAPVVAKENRLHWSHEVEEEGFEAIVREAINGVNAMPPRGGCMDCSDDEIRATVIHMLQLSGAK
ncbi:cytochrome c5 [Alcanivorax xiamenensis]|uniref:Cytochrome c5 n=1 Tax=Alcanivorax xiamenensis TaxID=1177156 RepID=A0ABQ6Y470_9GAMM|nr:c-type cytochrome [Alcanivorax xiamenensis]KAF0803114.1 cytochrome c5 [Alcanivorax xiamenensis]